MFITFNVINIIQSHSVYRFPLLGYAKLHQNIGLNKRRSYK